MAQNRRLREMLEEQAAWAEAHPPQQQASGGEQQPQHAGEGAGAEAGSSQAPAEERAEGPRGASGEEGAAGTAGGEGQQLGAATEAAAPAPAEPGRLFSDLEAARRRIAELERTVADGRTELDRLHQSHQARTGGRECCLRGLRMAFPRCLPASAPPKPDRATSLLPQDEVVAELRAPQRQQGRGGAGAPVLRPAVLRSIEERLLHLKEQAAALNTLAHPGGVPTTAMA